MAETPALKFGIEIEALFHPHDKDTRLVLFDFAEKLAEGNDEMLSGLNARSSCYSKWEIQMDMSVRGDGKHGPCEQ